MNDPVIGQTCSDMSLVWVACHTIPEGLRVLADELEERGVDDDVIAINSFYTGDNDEYDYQVQAVVERPLP